MLFKRKPTLISVSIVVADGLALYIALAGLCLSVVSTILIPFGRWVASRWRRIRYAERDLRMKAEEELLDCRKEIAVLQVKLGHCESELHESDFKAGGET